MFAVPTTKIVNLFARIVVLGIITFGALTLIPPTVRISMGLRIVITLLVVATYSILDMIGDVVTQGESQICNTLC